MTAVVGQGFSQIAAGPASAGRSGARSAGKDDATSFDDLVRDDGRRGAETASPRSGDAKSVAVIAGRGHDRADRGDADASPHGQAAGRIHHPHGTAGDDSPDDKSDDDAPPAAAGTGDGQPLRDRLPLLATLGALGHQGNAPATMPARIGAPAREPSTSAATGDGPGSLQPDDARLRITPRDPAADAIAFATKGTQPLRAAAAVVPPVQGRQAESGTTSSEAAGKAAAPGDTEARPIAMAPTALAPAGSTGDPRDDASPDGREDAQDGHAGPARAGHGAPARDEPSREPDRISRSADERRGSGSVTVVADRSFPAPAAHPLGQTTAGVIGALASVANQTPASALSQPPQASTVAHPAHVLRIELHPAELGAVTASLRMSGEQLSIELKPETAEAYRHLQRDSDTIVKSLRKLGLDVDSVTVVQPSIATQPAARADAGNQASAMPGRDPGQFQPGTSGGSGDGFGGQRSGRNHSHDGQPLERPTPIHRERAQGSLFI
jgi:chemotaxis protein MotD